MSAKSLATLLSLVVLGALIESSCVAQTPAVRVPDVSVPDVSVPAAVPDSTDDEIAVMVDFLQAKLGPPDKGKYNFDDNTTVGDFPNQPGMDQLPEGLAASFKQHNVTGTPLPEALVAKFPINRWSNADNATYFPAHTDLNDGWKRYYADFPHSKGIFCLSHVGFSRDGNYAILYFACLYASQGGSGNLYVLKRNPDSGHWELNGTVINLWIS